MILYRIENRHGDGPFARNGPIWDINREWSSKTGHPCPYDDLGRSSRPSEVCAVNSRSLFRHWFPTGVRRKLRASGYRLALYIADDTQVEHGIYQSLVCKSAEKVTKWKN